MTTTIFKWVGTFILCFVLQTTIVPVIAVFGVRPDLPLVALFFLAMKTGCLPAVWAGFFLGLTKDLYSPSILGQQALSGALAGFFAGLFNERVMRADLVFRLLLLFVTFLVSDTAGLLVQLLSAGSGAGFAGRLVHDLLAISVPRALYSMLFALVPYVKNYLFVTPFRR
ncbi:MAG: rod shape-determining protein MreD [Chitinispirillaceae bacterium]|jgi:rod shape-determining protein MreD|nr:rod shape-determining protein MreD [Chitinispirillaceae bacterium]